MRRSIYDRTTFLIFVMAILLNSCSSSGRHDLADQSVTTPSLGSVSVDDSFWTPLIERNRTVTIPYVFVKCEETGRIDNFAIAGGLKKGKHTGERYNDSDVFKIIEGACYTLMEKPDPVLRSYVDSLVALIAAAQEDDGYLYTTRTIDPVEMAPGSGRERWIDERVSHELYNVGHMYEAAVAHYHATGSDAFLKVALGNAELVYREFGWGKREIAPGHQEIEIGLMKLHRLTGDRRWLELAQFFLDVRGRPGDYVHHSAGSRFEVYNDSIYLQMHKPVLEQTEAVGHAVRGAYMYTAMACLSEATGESSYLNASRKLWDDVVAGKIYITGGIGSKEHGEAFGEPFELPNMSAYTETCASVGNVFWNHSLYSATGDAKYLDLLERTLYNGLISGIGADGCSFYYPNPLESDGRFQRAGWFECSCCPGNIARFMPQLKQYIWSETPGGVNVNLFISSAAKLRTPAGNAEVKMETSYPWTGKVSITINPETPGSLFAVGIRMPAWTGDSPFAGELYHYVTPCTEKVMVSVNGRQISTEESRGFMSIRRKWNRGDVIEVYLPMEPRFIMARDEVEADKGKVSLGVGPLVYCLEEADNGPVREIAVDPETRPHFAYEKGLIGGVGTLSFEATLPDGTEKKMKAIPYFSWANRGRGEMTVWINIKK